MTAVEFGYWKAQKDISKALSAVTKLIWGPMILVGWPFIDKDNTCLYMMMGALIKHAKW